MADLTKKIIENSGKGQHSVGAMSPDKVLKTELDLIGEDDSDGLPDAGVLAIVKMCREAEEKDDEYSPFVNEMLIYFKTALKMLASDEACRTKYGQSIRGANDLIRLLKTQYADIQGKAKVAKYIDDIDAVKGEDARKSHTQNVVKNLKSSSLAAANKKGIFARAYGN